MIKNGKPYTNEMGYTDFDLISELDQDKRDELLHWIEENISPSKIKNAKYDSYSLKHRFENSEQGFYLTNNQFKDAMMVAGYDPVNPDELNWSFKIKVAERWYDIDKLQRKLLPDQNEVLKNFIKRNFPSVHAFPKSQATNSYRYFIIRTEWFFNANKGQFVISLWKDDAHYTKRKTIRLPYIKGLVRRVV